MVRIDELKDQVQRNGIEVEQDRLRDGSWQLEPKSVTELIAKCDEIRPWLRRMKQGKHVVFYRGRNLAAF